MTLARSLTPADYQRKPWRNGGGITVDIAGEDGIWQLSRTPIANPGPFSDYSGFDRLQVLVVGRGLVLETATGEIDVREPFRPVRFAGETPINSRLEAGPVEVVNLLGRRDVVAVDLAILTEGESHIMGAGLHILYCVDPAATVTAGERCHQILPDHALRIDVGRSTMLTCREGRIIVATIARGA